MRLTIPRTEYTMILHKGHDSKRANRCLTTIISARIKMPTTFMASL